MKRKWLAIGVILLFMESYIIPVMAQDTMNTPFVSMTKTMTPISNSNWGETELKYYQVGGLSTLLGIGCPCIWKSAIRLTQMEMAPYLDWTLTKVNVAFSADHGCPLMMIRIYIYDKGDATHPGPIIANDTTFTLNKTGVTTIPLVTPVNLSDHEELWVAVEWHQNNHGYYAWLDTLTGPAVRGKGDWVYLNNAWCELYNSGPDYDGNWGIGAIVEGLGVTELAIGDINGPLGLRTNVSNIGADDAMDLQWSILLTGGLFNYINMTTTGTTALLAEGEVIPIHSRVPFGFGKITIMITAKATNTLQISITRNAFVVGPFVLKIT
jgi:hypothetical protein